jgi:hypothetical protein
LLTFLRCPYGRFVEFVEEPWLGNEKSSEDEGHQENQCHYIALYSTI